jgi:acyl carrier protein
MEFYPRTAGSPFLSELSEAPSHAAGEGAATGGLRAELANASAGMQRNVLFERIVECLSRVLRVPEDRIDVNAPFKDYGMDSLMSLEVRNRLEASTGLRLSAAILFTHSTATALCDYLLEEMGFVDHELEVSIDRVPNEDERMSEEAAAALLEGRLEDLEDYLR